MMYSYVIFLDETLKELQATAQQVGVHDIRLAEMDLRFQCLETANYGGVVIWKVTDYGRRKQDAFNDRVSSTRPTRASLSNTIYNLSWGLFKPDNISVSVPSSSVRVLHVLDIIIKCAYYPHSLAPLCQSS